MLKNIPPHLSVSALNEIKDYLRITLPNEDATLLSLLRVSLDICANFIAVPPLLTEYSEDLAVTGQWQTLKKSPVLMIDNMVGLLAEGSDFPLAVDSYEIDITNDRKGRFRVHHAGAAGRVRVSYHAGLSENWSSLAEPLRNGIIRLAAHIYSNRNANDNAHPPAAIAALWQPYRNVRII